MMPTNNDKSGKTVLGSLSHSAIPFLDVIKREGRGSITVVAVVISRLAPLVGAVHNADVVRVEDRCNATVVVALEDVENEIIVHYSLMGSLTAGPWSSNVTSPISIRSALW